MKPVQAAAAKDRGEGKYILRPAGFRREARMKITYEFVTGEVSGVEVDEHLGGMLLDLDRQQDNNDQKETRRHVSLDSMDYEGELFATTDK